MTDLAQAIQNLRAGDDPPEHTSRLLDSDDPANVSVDVFAHALQDSVLSVVLVRTSLARRGVPPTPSP